MENVNNKPAVGATQVSARKINIPNTTGVEGTVEVSRAIYHGKEERSRDEHNETIRVPLFNTEVAKVRVEGSVTRNLGDFNSCRVAVMIEMPCYPEQSEVQRVYEMVSGWLDVMIPTEIEKAIADDQQEVS